jgi:putative endonuclease
MKSGCVYLMANHCRGKTYLGVTSNMPQRAWQHRHGVVEGHSKAKGCVLLVWYEYFDGLQDARTCEYRMKKWKRAWKIRLIEERNPEWRDLYAEVCA